MVGMTGFEPATSYSRSKRTTKLYYIPMLINYSTFLNDVEKILEICYYYLCGRLAQLGEHFLDVEGVRGSSPLASTIFISRTWFFHHRSVYIEF